MKCTKYFNKNSNHRFSHIQAKIYIANKFRENSKMTNLTAIDRKIQ